MAGIWGHSMAAAHNLTLVFMASLLLAGCSPSGSSGLGGGSTPPGGGGGGGGPLIPSHPGVNTMQIAQTSGKFTHTPVAGTATMSGWTEASGSGLLDENQVPQHAILEFTVGGQTYKVAGAHVGIDDQLPLGNGDFAQYWGFGTEYPYPTQTLTDEFGEEYEVPLHHQDSDHVAEVMLRRHSLIAIAFPDRAVGGQFLDRQPANGAGYLIIDGDKTGKMPTMAADYEGLWAISESYMQFLQTECPDCSAGSFEGQVDFNHGTFDFDLISAAGFLGDPSTTGKATGKVEGNSFVGTLQTQGDFTSDNTLSGYFYGPDAVEMNGIISGQSPSGQSTYGVLLGQQQ